MSTKTTFKRIALVAVMALGLGTVATAPSNALVNTPSLTLAASTGTAIPGGTAATVATTVGFLAGAASDAVSTSAVLTSAPTGNTAFPTWAASTSATNATQGGATTQTMTTTAVAAGAVSHVANLTIGSNSFPLIAGVYVVTVTQGSLSATWTLTVAAAAGPTTAGSRVYMQAGALAGTLGYEAAGSLAMDAGGYTVKSAVNAGAGNRSYAATTALIDANVSTQSTNAANVTSLAVAVGTGGSTAWANLGVVLSNASTVTTSTITGATQDGAASYNPSAAHPFNAAGYPVTVSISGPGWVSYSGVIRGKSYTELSTDGQVNYLQRSFGIISDGTTGTSTITVSQGATVLATRTIVSYGALASLTATVVNKQIPLSAATIGAVTVVGKDASGNVVPVTPTVTSATTASIASGTCSASTATTASSCDITAGATTGSSVLTFTSGLITTTATVA